MRTECFEFRSRLSLALEGVSNHAGGHPDQGDQAGELRSLGWHEHLLSCLECRHLLEGEQLLDELLGSLPKPTLSESKRANLVVRLAENLRLEHWLDVADPFTEAPSGLADRVVRRTRERNTQLLGSVSEPHDRDHPLQVLALQELALPGLDSVQAPVGLADRIMQHCQDHGANPELELVPRSMQAKHTSTRKPPLLRHWLPVGLVAASLAAFLWFLPDNPNPEPIEPVEFVVDSGGNSDPDAEVLALLDSLEVLDLVDELDAEEWELVDQYDSYALFLVDELKVTDGEVR